MVENPRAEARTDPLRPVNEPVPIEMASGGDETPVRVCIKERWFLIRQRRDRWRVDDEWWRGEEISRMYFKVLLEDGREVTIFQDLVNKRWYLQSYD
ncbi:MAG: hypothetical protein O2783_07075 [Chloroflexi bacterium]|nr:hypothetical protein [Chloroflexota bacterium]